MPSNTSLVRQSYLPPHNFTVRQTEDNGVVVSPTISKRSSTLPYSTIRFAISYCGWFAKILRDRITDRSYLTEAMPPPTLINQARSTIVCKILDHHTTPVHTRYFERSMSLCRSGLIQLSTKR
jgi:hypothetical protein